MYNIDQLEKAIEAELINIKTEKERIERLKIILKNCDAEQNKDLIVETHTRIMNSDAEIRKSERLIEIKQCQINALKKQK